MTIKKKGCIKAIWLYPTQVHRIEGIEAMVASGGSGSAVLMWLVQERLGSWGFAPSLFVPEPVKPRDLPTTALYMKSSTALEIKWEIEHLYTTA